MPTLDEMLRGGMPGSAPGVNPELEQMLARINALQSGGIKGPGGGSPVGPGMAPAGAGRPGGLAEGIPTGQGTPMAPMQPGEAQPMQPQQQNLTYQALVKAGVPVEVARQAMGSPKMLQEILAQLQKSQSGAPAGAINNPQAIAGIRG